jgi:taurine--2-oxoglutarate transaminase
MSFPPIKEAKGIYLYGYNGKKYIDAKSQMMNVSFGHGIQSFKDAVIKQWDQVAYIPTMDGHGNNSADELAEAIIGILPGVFESVYFTTSGTSSCEVAIQIAKDYWWINNKKGKKKIISIKGCYHGNSSMMSEISEYGEQNKPYRLNDLDNYLKVLQPYCYRCPLDLNSSDCGCKCADVLRQQLNQYNTDEIGAIIFEVVQGSGVIALPDAYADVLKKFAEDNDILLIADEVLTGFGRTGYDFAFQKYGLLPNIVCLSKTISNGLLPLGATIFDKKITESLREREIFIGSTQDGNPVCTMLGSAVIKHFKSENWSERVKNLGEYFLFSLKNSVLQYSIVGDIRGEGLLICIELVKDKESKEPFEGMEVIHKGFLENGVFIFVENNFIFFVPPYIIDEKTIDLLVAKCKVIIADSCG